MTEKEKARAYDKAIEKIKYVMEHGVQPVLNKEDLQSIFPEIFESEDERIEKEIIAFLKENLETGRAEETWSLSGLKRWIAWLEKQGNVNALIQEAAEKSYTEGMRVERKRWLEKQGESKFYSWKPTKEQYEALDYAYNSCSDTERGNYYEGVLETLIEDLHRLEKQGEQNLASSAKISKNEDTFLDLLHKMPSCITVDGIDYHFVLKKTVIYMAFYEGEGEGSGKVIFWMAGDPIVLLMSMLKKLKEKGLLDG